MNPHLIMPMAGAGSRFFKGGFTIPKPLIKLKEKPFFYWATRSIEKFVTLERITYVVLEEHVKKFSLDRIIKNYYPEANIVVIPEITPGPVFSSLEGVKTIEDKCPIIINDCDHMFECSEFYSILKSTNNQIDGALLTFESSSNHFSYIKYDINNKIIGTVEKKIVSNHAICGAYYFRNAEIFKTIAQEYIENCPYKETFLSGMYNIMCKYNMNIKDYLLDWHLEFGTPEEYDKAKYSDFFYNLL